MRPLAKGHPHVTNRLSFWIVVAVVFALTACGLLVGPTLAALLGLLHVPMLLALLLLARAVVLRVRSVDAGLRVGDRTMLGGAAAIAAPLVFLVAWSALREVGVVDAELSLKRHNHNLSTATTPWTDGAPANVIPEVGLVVVVPEGVFGDAVRRQLRQTWVPRDGVLRGEVKVEGEVPSSWWPLRKSASVHFKVHVDLQVHRRDGRVRSSAVDLEWKAECEALGITSNRAFQRWIGAELGDEVRQAIGNAVKASDRAR